MTTAPSRADVVEIYPLLPMQRGMLFHILRSPDAGTYFEHLTCTLRGPLDREAFAEAWQEVVRRHDILRTAFVSKGADVQVLLARAPISITYRSLVAASEDERRSEIDAFLAEDRARGFDLGKAPLMRLTLFEVGPGEHRVVWSHHHLLLDGWSLPLLMREVFALYDAFARGVAPPRSEARPFADYLRWIAKRDPAVGERHFREAFEGFRAPVPLELGAPPPWTAARDFDDVRIAIPRDATAALAAFARESALTLAAVVQGAWALLLAHVTGSDDVAFGATFSGRSAAVPGIEAMVGVFINTLPIRARVAADGPALDVLTLVQRQVAATREHEHVPLAEALRAAPALRGRGLFETLVVFENYPVDAGARLGAAGLFAEDVHVADKSSFPLTLFAGPGEELKLRVSYDAWRFEARAIEALARALVALLSALPRAALEPAAVLTARCAGTLARGRPRAPAPLAAREIVAPKTPLEADLLALWESALGVSPIGVTEDFFALPGAGSLAAVQLVTDIERKLGRAVPLSLLFRAPTIERVAKVLEGEVALDAPIDLAAAARLDPSITITDAARRAAPPRSALLTGATGFLGAFLLDQLARAGLHVHALVRAPDVEAARARLAATLTGYGLAADALDGVTPVVGDLAGPLFGLSDRAFADLAERVDLVVHNGAQVSFALPFQELERANVRGTETAVRMAARAGAALHHVSSLAVFTPEDFAGPLLEGPPTAQPERLPNAYAQTKWAAEVLVAEARARGVAVAVHRPGGVAGHSRTGVFNASDLVVKAIRACVALRCAPDVDMLLDFTPVDYVAGAIAHMAAAEQDAAGVFHLASPAPISVRELAGAVRALGYEMELVPLPTWRARLRELVARVPGSQLTELLALASRDADPARPWRPSFDTTRARAALAGSPFEACPPPSALLPTYFDAFARAGLVPPRRR